MVDATRLRIFRRIFEVKDPSLPRVVDETGLSLKIFSKYS